MGREVNEMTLTAHVAIGSAVGLATGNPVAAFLAGWLSHHVADMVAHTDLGSAEVKIDNLLSDRKNQKIVFADVATAIIIFVIFALKSDRNTLVFWGAFGGMFPDLVDNSPFWNPAIRRYFPFNFFHLIHETAHYTIKKRKYFWFGILTQIVAVIISLCYLFLWWR
jgi:hypothetical protein